MSINTVTKVVESASNIKDIIALVAYGGAIIGLSYWIIKNQIQSFINSQLSMLKVELENVKEDSKKNDDNFNKLFEILYTFKDEIKEYSINKNDLKEFVDNRITTKLSEHRDSCRIERRDYEDI